MFHTFAFCCCCLVGVYGDEVKSVSVMEGDSVILESGVTEIQTEDLISWMFGHKKTRIAEIDKEEGKFSTSDGPDGRFRDRLKLDHQTGSLTITHTTITHSGEYEVIIRNNRVTIYSFTVTVYVSPEGHAPFCDSAEAVLRLVVTALMGVASAIAVVLLVIDVRSTRAKMKETEDI